MKYDYSEVEDTQSFVAIPPGIYPCTVAEVRKGYARNGSERWSLRLEVAEGEYAGRTAAWDGLTWSERGVRRVKLVLAALGFEVDGTLDLEPADLEGCQALVEVQPEVWEDPENGKRQERMSIPFAGWTPLTGDAVAEPSGEGQSVVDGGRPTGEARPHGLPVLDDTPF